MRSNNFVLDRTTDASSSFFALGLRRLGVLTFFVLEESEISYRTCAYDVSHILQLSDTTFRFGIPFVEDVQTGTGVI